MEGSLTNVKATGQIYMKDASQSLYRNCCST